ncbi:hypothetical protein [Xylanibacter rodentium]|uniref:hypothetical protein n=1 Tax=Xylanibacter rodentium TaxID=2736289 RepID=UPI002598C4B4|nr:hypothetical protein [Xylanibacter rodentium]
MATVIEKMRKLILFIFLIMTLPFMVMFIGCGHKSEAWDTMDTAEVLMDSMPDSALTVLSSIEKTSLGDDKEKARYALLMSMALDKNYIDTTSFDVLQPAIDYYLEKGTPEERLRTLYYQGCIFLNKSDFDMAMQCYLKAEDLKDECKDTITYANMLVAQGNIYAKSCQIEGYVRNNLCASELYNKIGEQRRELSSLIRALDGCISLGNIERSDSLMSRTDSLVQIHPELNEASIRVKMTYGIRFNSDSVINNILGSISDLTQYDDETKLDITLGYLNLNEPLKAKMIFESIAPDNPKTNSFRYISIKPEVLEAAGEYEKALDAYKKFHSTVESENSKIYSQKTTVAQELHEIKINHLYSIQRKNMQIWLGLCVLLILIIVICIIYYQLRLGKIKRIISEQEQSRLQLENENLQKQKSVLELERHNAQLECEKQNLATENMKLKISQLESDKHNAELEIEKKNLAAENMRLKISQLESEGEHLKELLTEAKLSKPVLDAIKERSDILNGLLAAKISDNDTYSKPYDIWINQITEDRKSFMNSTRLAFRASHPAFMKYLEDHGLTESELNYVCLYAIGLRGKEIGEYIQIKRHYHTSTDIRKKLGLKEDDTNLGLHIRNLMKKL